MWVWSLAWELRFLHTSEQLSPSAKTETQSSKININFRKRAGRVERVLSTDWFFLGLQPWAQLAPCAERTNYSHDQYHVLLNFSPNLLIVPLHLPSWGADEVCDLLWEPKVFLGHDNRFPPDGWLKTTEIYPHRLGGGRCEVEASTGLASSGNSETIRCVSYLLVVPSLVAESFQPLFPSSHHLLLCVLCSYKDISFWI